jgi:plastocyanin
MVVLALALVGVSACGSSSKAKPPAAPAPVDERGKQAVTVAAKDNQFTPASIIVDPGTKVTWSNTDTVAHDVKKQADTVDFGGPFGVDPESFGPGQSYSFTFTKPGVYYYTCTIHAGMTGRVQVGS